MAESNTLHRGWIRTGWTLVGLTLLVLTIFTILRSLNMASGVMPDNPFEWRYHEQPWTAGLHMFVGMTFVLFAPLQFLPRLRAKYRKLHRYLGRTLIIFGLLSVGLGMIATWVMPVFGGLASTSAAWFFGPIMAFCLLRGYLCARQRRFPQHREWMIRSFALGLGVGTQRMLLGVLMSTGQYDFYEVFGPGLWLGFGINLVVAEIWINISRKH